MTTFRSKTRLLAGVLSGAAVLALAVLVVVNVVGASGSPAQEGSASRSGEPAPEVTFERWDGGTGTLADYRGRPLVLNFWASWCPPCRAEMPGFEQVHQNFGDEVAFLGLDLQDDRADAEALVAQTGVTYDLGVDPTGEVFQVFDGIGMPTTVFISAGGEVLDRHTGTLTEQQLTERIEMLFFGS